MVSYLSCNYGNPSAYGVPITFDSYKTEQGKLSQTNSLLFVSNSELIRLSPKNGLVRVVVSGRGKGHASIIIVGSNSEEVYRVPVSSLIEQ